MFRRICLLLICLLMGFSSAWAKSSPPPVLTWPPEGQAMVRLTFSKFNENVNVTMNGARLFTAEVLAENLWDKPIHTAVFRVYCFDKQDVRNGETLLTINELPVGGKSKLQVHVGASATPDRVQLEAVNVPDEFAAAKFGKQAPGQVLTWPGTGTPLVRVAIGVLKQIGAYNGEDNFTADVFTENMWTKPIHLAAFHVYFYDNQDVRIGESYLSVSDLQVSGKAKSDLSIRTRGIPSRLELVPVNVPEEFAGLLPKKEIPITVNSVPQGAVLKVDGVDQGTTPKIVKFSSGKHVLTFLLEGYAEGHYPFEVKPDDAPGGSITLELGSATHDTVELRDGSVLTGDVENLSATQMEIMVGGLIQKVNRNSIKRIVLIERMPPSAQAK